MAEIAEYTIILFENELSELKEILDMSLNLIFFHRNLSSNNYEDAQSKLTNITYVKLKNENLSREIANIITEIENHFTGESKLYGCILTLSFFEKAEKKENPWEKWNFISILDKKEYSEKKNENKDEEKNSDIDKETKVREYMFKIIEKLNDKGNYMPNVNLNDDNFSNETFLHKFRNERIQNEGQYMLLFNKLFQKNQEDVIVMNI